MAMAAGEVAEVAEVDLECLQGIELDIDRIDFLHAFFEGSYHRDLRERLGIGDWGLAKSGKSLAPGP
jgi:hypothetical protein